MKESKTKELIIQEIKKYIFEKRLNEKLDKIGILETNEDGISLLRHNYG